jgi:hypothetical protein
MEWGGGFELVFDRGWVCWISIEGFGWEFSKGGVLKKMGIV